MIRSSFVALTLVIALACHAGLAWAQEDEASSENQDPTATDRALAELGAAYESLAGLLGQGSEQAADAVQEDIENVGDWEYRIVVLEMLAPETIEAELNALGDERWEVFWVETEGNQRRLFLKRPSLSYLSRVPLGTLIRLLGGGIGQ